VQAAYDLEYGSDCLEIHSDAVTGGQRVLIVDDLLATGGTARATMGLVKDLGGVIEAVTVLIELVDLGGRARLEGERIVAVLQY
jgi:adenine phosphoribosyltransferase